MFRCCIKRSLYCVLWPFGNNTADVLTGKTETEKKRIVELQEALEQEESGWDRVKKIFDKNEFGGLSPELNSITQVTWLSIFVGALYGGINYSREAYLNFIKNNQASAFQSHYDAKKKLQDAVSLSFAKGALKWSWRIAVFSTTFVGTYTLIQIYRNKYGIIEYCVAGMTAGFVYKFTMGPRGWIVGVGLGGVLGLVGGGLTNFLLSLGGLTMEEARFYQNHWQDKRSQYHAKKLEEQRQREENILLYKYSKTHPDTKLDLETINDNKS